MAGAGALSLSAGASACCAAVSSSTGKKIPSCVSSSLLFSFSSSVHPHTHGRSYLHAPKNHRIRVQSPPVAASAQSQPPFEFEFELSPPPIDHDSDPLLLATDLTMTAGEQALDGWSVETSTSDDLATIAALKGVAVADLSHFGRIRVTGDDRIQFLHNQTTAKFDSLTEGEGCDTAFVTPTARTIDIAHAWIMKNAIMLLVSPSTCASISEMLQKYIFYADKVEVHDITKKTCFFALVGPKSNQVMKALKLDDLIGQSYGTHRHYTVNGMPVTVGVGSVLCRDGFSFLLSPSSSGVVWKVLLSLGAIPMDANAWERLRVLQGRPAPGRELTGDFNVLEAGLWDAVSLDKGCYKGQETISRLLTYGGVKQKLWGIQLSGPAEPGSKITLVEDGRKVGVLTSYSVGKGDGEHFGLGYVKRQVGLGGQVRIGDATGALVQIQPKTSHDTDFDLKQCLACTIQYRQRVAPVIGVFIAADVTAFPILG